MDTWTVTQMIKSKRVTRQHKNLLLATIVSLNAKLIWPKHYLKFVFATLFTLTKLIFYITLFYGYHRQKLLLNGKKEVI